MRSCLTLLLLVSLTAGPAAAAEGNARAGLVAARCPGRREADGRLCRTRYG